MRDLLKSAEAERLLRSRADAVAAAAGPGHITDSSVGRNRARAAVLTASFEAKLAEARDHNLLRSIDAGR